MDWEAIARQDRELSETISNGSEALAKLRYDNTLGAGVSFREYARHCGIHEQNVRLYARAWVAHSENVQLSISDALVRASTDVERADVTEVIAQARQVTPKTIQAHHGDEVRRVQTIAKERAEKHGTTVREEAEKLAEMAARAEKAKKAEQKERRKRLDLRYLELEKHLHNARRALVNAVAVDAELDDEHKELLRHAIGTVKDLLALVDLKFIGAADVDWDGELARLEAQ